MTEIMASLNSCTLHLCVHQHEHIDRSEIHPPLPTRVCRRGERISNRSVNSGASAHKGISYANTMKLM